MGTGAPTLAPNQMRVALMKSRREIKATRLTRILAMRGIEAMAPEEAASMMLLSGLLQ